MNKYTTVPNQASPVMSLWFLRVGAFQDLCVIVLHIPFSHHNLLFGSLKWDIRQSKPLQFPEESRMDSVSHHALAHQRKKNYCAGEETIGFTEPACMDNRTDLETG